MIDYDPERKLWVPGRRSFLFMFGSAMVGTALPALPETGWIAIDEVRNSDLAVRIAMASSGEVFACHVANGLEQFNRAILRFVTALEQAPPSVLAGVKT